MLEYYFWDMMIALAAFLSGFVVAKEYYQCDFEDKKFQDEIKREKEKEVKQGLVNQFCIKEKI